MTSQGQGPIKKHDHGNSTEGGTFPHDNLSDDVSGAADENNSGDTFVQDVTMDGHGHVTALGTGTASTTTVVASGSASPTNNEPHAVYTLEDSANNEYDTGVRDLTNGINFPLFSEGSSDDPKALAWSWSALDTPTIQWQVERA